MSWSQRREGGLPSASRAPRRAASGPQQSSSNLALSQCRRFHRAPSTPPQTRAPACVPGHARIRGHASCVSVHTPLVPTASHVSPVQSALRTPPPPTACVHTPLLTPKHKCPPSRCARVDIQHMDSLPRLRHFPGTNLCGERVPYVPHVTRVCEAPSRARHSLLPPCFSQPRALRLVTCARCPGPGRPWPGPACDSGSALPTSTARNT